MLDVPGISPEMVERHAEPFLRLVRNAQSGYENLMRQQEQVPQDPNHENVIDISSDEENNVPDFDSEDEEELDGEGSRFFQPSADVEAFNAKRACPTHLIHVASLTSGSHAPPARPICESAIKVHR